MLLNKKRTRSDTNHTNEEKKNFNIENNQIPDLPEELLNRSFDYLGLKDRTGIQSVSNNIRGIVRSPDTITIEKPTSQNYHLSDHFWIQLSKQFPDISELTYLPEVGYEEVKKVLSLWPKITRIYIEHLRMENESFEPLTNKILRINHLTLYSHRQIPTLPVYVKKLKLLFDQPMDNVVLPISLTHIDFGYSFNQPIDNIAFPDLLTHLKFGHLFNQEIHHAIFPNYLTHLTFGYSFDQSINKIASLTKLTHLTLEAYEQQIQQGVLHEGLTHLTLGLYDMGGVILPKSLTYLHLINDLKEKEIKELVFPPNLTHLTLEGFTGKIKNGFLSRTKLTSLVLGPYFDAKIEKGNLPSSLTRLTLGKFFNNDVSLPSKLTHLSLGTEFNRPIRFLHEGLTHLMFEVDSCFNQIISQDDLPESLTHLYFGSAYDQELTNNVFKNQLTHLKFGLNYNKTITEKLLPPNLTHLTIGGYFEKKIELLPTSLTHLNIDIRLKNLIFHDVIPDGLVHVTVRADTYEYGVIQKYIDKITTTTSLPVSLKKIVIKASSDGIWAARKYFREYELLPNRWNLVYEVGEVVLTKY